MGRNYQHTTELPPQMKEMPGKGMTQKQGEDTLRLSGTGRYMRC